MVLSICRVVLLTLSVLSAIPTEQSVVLAFRLLVCLLLAPGALPYSSAQNGIVPTIPLVGILCRALLTFLPIQPQDVIEFVLQELVKRLLHFTTTIQLVTIFRLLSRQRAPQFPGIQPLIERIRPPIWYSIESLWTNRTQRLLILAGTRLKLMPTLLTLPRSVVPISRPLRPLSSEARSSSLTLLIPRLKPLISVYILTLYRRVQLIQLASVTESTPLEPLAISNYAGETAPSFPAVVSVLLTFLPVVLSAIRRYIRPTPQLPPTFAQLGLLNLSETALPPVLPSPDPRTHLITLDPA